MSSSQSQPIRDACGTTSDAEPSAEWVVAPDTFGDFFAAGPISKRTAQRVYHPDKWSGKREQFTDLSRALYVGPEDAAKRLLARLQSSRALMNEERQAATARHAKRVADLVAKAEGEAKAAQV